MHIAIAGNIGAGKTSLTELLAKHYKWEAHFEDVIDNPYLDDFYNHMERWSFNLQIYFLKSRFQQLLRLRMEKRLQFKIEPSTRMPIFLHPTSRRWGS